MASAAQRDTFFSAFLQSLLKRLDSCGHEYSAEQNLFGSVLFKKIIKLSFAISCFVDDAENKQNKSSGVKQWLDKVIAALYDVDDVVDEITTVPGRRQLETKSLDLKTLMLNLIGPAGNFVRSNGQIPKRTKIMSLVRRMEHLKSDAKHLYLEKVSDVSNLAASAAAKQPFERFRCETTSLVDESIVYGREKDKEAIIKLLLSDDDDGISVISIVGMAGSGKTTLAQLAFNDILSRYHFDIKSWAYVGDELDFGKVYKSILESKKDSSMNQFLKEKLKGKKFLFVLDNVLIENESDWKILLNPLTAGAKGSKVIVTTRSWSVAQMVSTKPVYDLQLLSNEDCWSILSSCARLPEISRSNRADLDAIGQKIARKCSGLPLAATILGRVLSYQQTSVGEWMDILKRNIWSIETETKSLSDISFSYHQLPLHMKQCFAYCSIFPKGYEFDKEKLIRLWMAESFLPQHLGEKAGEDYFNRLLSMSFFQPSSTNKSCFVMHDIISDLAQFVSEDFCVRLEDGYSYDMSARGRRASYARAKIDPSEKFNISYTAKRLRTFLLINSPDDHGSCPLSSAVLQDLLMKIKSLRVLSLSLYNITEMPDSIGKMKHLRYLDLSHTALKSLPASVSSLYNLQTLDLTNCTFLRELPKETWKLINLHHLLINATDLQELPLRIGKLTNLQTLTNFIISYGGSRIDELLELSNLRGSLSISKLHNLDPNRDALDGILTRMRYLDELKLEWSSKSEDPERDQGVLEKLVPSRELKRLTIESYGGKKFPHWLGDSSFSNLVFLLLSKCWNCLHLLPLGQLPSLEVLEIKELSQLTRLGEEFYGHSSSSKPFQSLKTLQFDSMLEWEEWGTQETEDEGFPCLVELQITNCPKLKGKLPKHLPSLRKLVISKCSQLSLPVTPAKCEVWIDEKKVQPRTEEEHALQSEISNPALEVSCECAVDKPNDALQSAQDTSTISTTRDKAEDQAKLFDSSHQITEHPIVTQLEKPQQTTETAILPQEFASETTLSSTSHDEGSMLQSDNGAEPFLSQDGLQNYDLSAGVLNVSNIAQLRKLPTDLRSLKIERCEALESLPLEILSSNLLHLYVVDCSFLTSLPVSAHPTALKTLHIQDCRKLEFPFTSEMSSQYANLENLCIWSSCDSLKSFHLSFFPKLRILCLWDCMNLDSISYEGLNEKDLDSLEALEIRDCSKLKSIAPDRLPAPKLKSIFFSNCQILKSLPRQMHHLRCLQSIFVSKCPEFESLPTDLPASLNLLCITFCDKFTLNQELELNRLDALNHFEIEGGCENMEKFPEEGLLPANLISLRISSLPDLKYLDEEGLQQLTTLKKLEINSCKRLRSLPEEFPSSLSSLSINQCPLLKAKLQNKNGTDWYNIANIPSIYVDGEESH